MPSCKTTRGHDGLPRRMDTSEIQVIRDWPTPRRGKDVQSFLGFANFYRRFIATYSDITVPLTRLTRKDAPWVWSLQCEDAFQLLKTAFTLAPILHHFDPSLPPVVETDASGILSVRTEDGQVHPSRSSVAPYLVPISTTTLTIWSYSPSSKLSRPGNIISSLVTIRST